MTKLHAERVRGIGEYLAANCRELEVARYSYLVGAGSAGAVVRRLREFQNSDGGFGNGVEPDFNLPGSSPIATSVAFQIIDEIHGEGCGEVIRRTMAYLESVYSADRPGWRTVGEEVNNHPHAPWWHYLEESGGTPIDRNWGNPSAELLGYMIRFGDKDTPVDRESLVDHALRRVSNLPEPLSEHEIYCFLRLYEALSDSDRKRFHAPIQAAVEQAVERDTEKWVSYVPRPTDFAPTPDSPFASCFGSLLEEDLDQRAKVGNSGVWEPNWQWGAYLDAWTVARQHWIGVLAVKNVAVLQAHRRIG